MNATIEDLRPTIVPKSDQLNSEQLLGAPMTVVVTDVQLSGSDQQPVIVHYVNDDGRPYKPCLTMRKLLIHAWGSDGREWHGRSMTLYNDPAVKFGGEDVGGIRISHMTDIERDIKVSLTSTRGKKAKYEVRRLSTPLAGQLADITGSPTTEALKASFGAAYQATRDPTVRAQLKQAYDARLVVLMKPVEFDEVAFMSKLDTCTDIVVLDLLLDSAADVTDEAMRARIDAAYDARRAEVARARAEE